MRKFVLLSLAVFLIACGEVKGEASTAGSVSMDDQRYMLSLHATPTMTFSTAKACYQLARIGEEEIKKTPGIMGEIFGEHFKPYWKFIVDIGSESDASKKDIFINGKFVESEIKPSLVLTGGVSARSEQCGYVTGQMLSHSGFVNIGDIIEVEDTTDGVTFDSDQALGMYIMGQAAEHVFLNNQAMVVDCAATLRAALPHGEEPDANYFVWMSSLADVISEGGVKSSALSTKSEAFKRLYGVKGDSVLALEGVDKALKSTCVEIASSAVEKIQGEVQK